MVAWGVINRKRTRQTPPSFFPAPIPILGLTPPPSQEKLSLCFHTLAWNPFYKPFVFKFMHGMGGVYPSASRVPIPCFDPVGEGASQPRNLSSFPMKSVCPERPSVWKGLSSPYILTSLLPYVITSASPSASTTDHCHYHPFLIRPALLLESRLDAGTHHPLHPLHLAPLRRRLHRHRFSPPPRNLSIFQPSNLPTLLSSAFLLDRHRHHHRHPPALPLLQTYRCRCCPSPMRTRPRRLPLELRLSYPGPTCGTNLARSLLRRLSIPAFQRSSSVLWRFDISTFNLPLSTFNSSSPLPCCRHHRVSLRRSLRTLRHRFVRRASRSLVHHLPAGPRPRQFNRAVRI